MTIKTFLFDDILKAFPDGSKFACRGDDGGVLGYKLLIPDGEISHLLFWKKPKYKCIAYYNNLTRYWTTSNKDTADKLDSFGQEVYLTKENE